MTNLPQQFAIADIYPAAKKVADAPARPSNYPCANCPGNRLGTKTLEGTNNLFNVKADASWHGKTKDFTVPEYDENKNMHMSKETFRVYDSYEDRS